jgi:hypothetical protein
VIFLSWTSSAIFLITPPSPPFLTMKGSSVTMIASLPWLSGSLCARARTRMRPRPVSNASRMPVSPRIMPPVGKSGPFMWRIRPGTSMSGSSMKALVRGDRLAQVVRRDVRAMPGPRCPRSR